MNGAKIIAPEVSSDIEKFKAILATVQDIDPDSIETFNEDIILTKEEKARRVMQLRVRKLLSDKDPDKRLLAVRNLSRRTDSVDHVPTLIYALSDPDRRIALGARDALRFISRRFGGVGMPDSYNPNPKDSDKEQLRAKKEAAQAILLKAQEDWRQWYRTIRPDAKDLGFGF